MSDGSMRGLTGLVVGTAGHVDHGKTSLVYALTGIDTDRLKEEKRRGISIDLGFAQLQLSGGAGISFVDVPGHERFVRNMLAGAAGIEAVMLIVAANESVMPQTREHFEICQLLGLRHGLIVVTKCDLATAEQMARVRSDIKQLVKGSFLTNAPVVEVSAVTMIGLPELKTQLAALMTTESGRDQSAVARMHIDRSFAMKGFGTVVTGTLQAGTITVGETLELHPQKGKVRVRALQSQHEAVQQVGAGQRVAINLAGVEQRVIKRGNVVASPDSLTGTKVIDVELRWLDLETPPSARELFVLHLGTAETGTRITIHRGGSDLPSFARLRLTHELMALPGDRCVIRRPSPAETVGGGIVIDAFPPRVNKAKTQGRLSALASANTLERRVEILLDEALTGRSMADLIRMIGASRIQLQTAIQQSSVIAISSGGQAITRRWIESKQREVVESLAKFHKENPTLAGMPLSGARLGLSPGLAELVLKDFAALRIQGETVALASHQVQFSLPEAAAIGKIENAFLAGGFQPPAMAEVLISSGLDAKKARTLLESLVKSNRLIRLPDDLVFHVDVMSHIRTSLTQHKGRRFSVAEFKGWINISRKFAIPLLEYLDQQRVTKRDGEVRVVL